MPSSARFATRAVLTAAGVLLGAAGCGDGPPVREGFVTTADSVRLYYRVVGDGEPTVIAPLALFHVDRLDPIARGRRLVLYDPRGRGRSDAVDPSKVSSEHQLRDLEAIREVVGAEQVALIGWSGMGMELFVYARRHPEIVTRLVQLAPVPPRQTPYMEQMLENRRARIDIDALEELRARRDAGEFEDDPAGLCRAATRITGGANFADAAKAAERPDVCVHANEWPQNLGPYFEALLGSFGSFDWRPHLDSVTIPRLVIHGAQDPIPLEGNREWVASQPSARILIVEGAGHWPHYEQPDVVLPAIDAFLSGRWPSGSKSVR